MTEEQLTVVKIKRFIEELPSGAREQTEAIAEHFRRMVRDAGTSDSGGRGPVRIGQLALALVGAELDAEQW